MIKRIAYWIVLKDLVKCNMFTGIYDARSGSDTFMYGVSVVMESIAYKVGEMTGDKFADEFTDNMISSERKAERKEKETTATISLDAFPKSIIQMNVVEVSDESIEKIADAVMRKLTDRKTEPSNSEIPNNCEVKICDTCRYYNSNIPCGSTPSACKEADKFAKEFVDGLKKLKSKDKPTIFKMEQVEDEPQTDCAWR